MLFALNPNRCGPEKSFRLYHVHGGRHPFLHPLLSNTEQWQPHDTLPEDTKGRPSDGFRLEQSSKKSEGPTLISKQSVESFCLQTEVLQETSDSSLRSAVAVSGRSTL
jgi:hypothetical protein